MGICRDCSANLSWARTTKGFRLPLDLEPVENGNIWLDEDGVAHVLTKGETPPAGPLYVSHFATCPDAAKARRSRR